MATVESITSKRQKTVSKPTINVESITGERLLTVEETAAIIGAAVGTMNRARIFGGNFPAYIKRGKSVRYKLSTVTRWMLDQEEHRTTSEIDAKTRAAA